MKKMQTLCSLMLSASLLFGMGGLSTTGEERVPDGSPTAVLLDSLNRHYPEQKDGVWRRLTQDASWRVQYFKNPGYADVESGQLAPDGKSGSIGLGRNDAGYISIGAAKKSADSAYAPTLSIVPREPGTDGYERMALAYTVPESGEYLLTADERYDVIQMTYAQSHPEYYTPEYSVTEDCKFAFAVYVNDTRIYPESAEWQYLTPQSLSAELPTLTKTLKAGDVVRYVTYSGESTADPWLNGITLSPLVYLNRAPVAQDMTLLCTQGKDSAETSFQVNDQSGKPIRFAVADAPQKGSVRITHEEKGLFVYTAQAGMGGQTDSFTFTAENALGKSEKATVTVNIVKNQPAYPTVTAFQTVQDTPLENQSLKVVDPDAGYTGEGRSDAIDVLLRNGWDLTGDTTANPGVFPAEKTAASFPDDGWTAAYKAVTNDNWRPMDNVVQWNSGEIPSYPGGEEIVYYSDVSENIYYRLQYADGALYSWFKLETCIQEDRYEGDPWGSLVYTAPQAGKYRFTGNSLCPNIGIPLLELEGVDGINFSASFWIEVNGTELDGTRFVFNKQTVSMPFPETTLDLHAGDTVRFVVSMGQSWAGWRQRFMMAPQAERLVPKNTVTVSVKSQPQNGAAEITDPSGLFRYTPHDGFSGTDTFVVFVDDGQDVTEHTVTIAIQKDEKPVVTSVGAAVKPGETVTVALAGTDDHNKPLSFRITGTPANGTASLEEAEGFYRLTYTPNSGFTGYETISIVCNDGKYDSEPGTVMLAVTDSSYDALSAIRQQVTANAIKTEGNTRVPYLIDNILQYPWRTQYYYRGVTGDITLETERVYMTAGAAIWQTLDGYEVMIVNDNWRTCGGSATEITGAADESLSISSGYTGNAEDPVGALSFFAPEDGTYMLLPDESFPYFSPTGIAKQRLNRPVELWIEKDGKKIWPADADAMKVGADDDMAKLPPILVSLKKDAKIRICVKGFCDENGDYMAANVRPVVYAVGAYNAALDPKPEGEKDYFGGGETEEPTVPVTPPTEPTAPPNKPTAPDTTAARPTGDDEQTPAPGPDTANDPINGMYLVFNEEVLRRQVSVAENGLVTVRLLCGEAVLTPAMAAGLTGYNLSVEFCEESGEARASWNLPDVSAVTEDLALGVRDTVTYEAQLADIFAGHKRQNVILTHRGALPQGTTLTLRNAGSFQPKENAFLYRLTDRSRLDKLETKVLLTSDASYLRIALQQGGDYFISDMNDKETIQIKTQPSPAKGLPWYAVTLIVVGGILAAGGAAVLSVGLIRKHKKGRNPQQ